MKLILISHANVAYYFDLTDQDIDKYRQSLTARASSEGDWWQQWLMSIVEDQALDQLQIYPVAEFDDEATAIAFHRFWCSEYHLRGHELLNPYVPDTPELMRFRIEHYQRLALNAPVQSKPKPGRPPRPVAQYLKDTLIAVYPSIRVAAQAFGKKAALLNQALSGGYRFMGYRWKYCDDPL